MPGRGTALPPRLRGSMGPCGSHGGCPRGRRARAVSHQGGRRPCTSLAGACQMPECSDFRTPRCVHFGMESAVAVGPAGCGRTCADVQTLRLLARLGNAPAGPSAAEGRERWWGRERKCVEYSFGKGTANHLASGGGRKGAPAGGGDAPGNPPTCGEFPAPVGGPPATNRSPATSLGIRSVPPSRRWQMPEPTGRHHLTGGGHHICIQWIRPPRVAKMYLPPSHAGRKGPP